MKIVDQLGRSLELPETPLKVISLVPSITEMLYALGVEPVAQTIFCIHPADKFKDAAKIGGTKKLKISEILDLNPDLVIANKEENLKEEIEPIAQKVPTYISDIGTISEAERMIEDIGLILDCENKASALIKSIRNNRQDRAGFEPRSYLYLIWREPYFVTGSDTFITDMLNEVGLVNAFNEDRYKEISMEDMRRIEPDYVFLSSEPYPFKIIHVNELQPMLPDSKVVLIDGEMVSWYGSRIPDGLKYLKEFRANLD